MSTSPSIVLKASNLETLYGPVVALRGVSLDVHRGQIVALLGGNGAGKTTILRTLSGVLEPRHGTIVFDHQDITSLNPATVSCMGLRHVPEGRELFPLLTVEENLKVGAGWRASAQDIAENTEMVLDYFPRLRDRTRHLAGYLSGGEQQMVAIGRALMGNPKLLMLDEPSLGLSPLVRLEVFRIVQKISRDRNLPMLLVEQNAQQALQIADFAYVLELGRIVMADTADRISRSDEIQQFYLGKKKETIRGQQRWKRKKVWR